MIVQVALRAEEARDRANRRRGRPPGRLRRGGRRRLRSGDDPARTINPALTGFSRPSRRPIRTRRAGLRHQRSGRSTDHRSGSDPRLRCARWKIRSTDIATLTVEITDEHEKTNPNVVKVVGSPLSATRLSGALFHPRHRALWPRARSITISGSTPIAATALEKFVSLGPSALEKRESLEQLRALEAGMRIDVEIVETGSAWASIRRPISKKPARILFGT